MQISFDCPHLFNDKSRLSENGKKIFKECMAKLRGNANRNVPPLTRNGSLVTFDLPFVFHAGSTPTENAIALQALLHCLTAINEDYLRHCPDSAYLYESGIYYDRTEIWDSIPALYRRGYGDCKSLSCALVAERRAQRREAVPVFRWVAVKESSAPFHVFYHILVLAEDGWGTRAKFVVW